MTTIGMKTRDLTTIYEGGFASADRPETDYAYDDGFIQNYIRENLPADDSYVAIADYRFERPRHVIEFS